MAASLVDLLSENMIRLKVSAGNWEDALRQGGQLLIDGKGVELCYVDAIIKTVKDLGPYVVIAPGLALGHAGPDMGVLKTCFSLITLEEPVEFGVPENDPVDIIFCFAAPNKQEHMEALRDMALFCSEQKNLNAIRAAIHVCQIRELLIKFFQS